MPKFTLKQVEETQRQMDKAEAVKKAASSTSTPKYRELPALKKNNNAKAVDLSTANTQVVPKGTQVISPSAMRNNSTLSSARSNLTAITDSNANKVLNRSDNIARQKRQASLTKTGKFASEHPVLSTAYNTITAPISAIGSAVENMVGAIDGNNSNRFAIQRANIKEGTKSNINSNAGNMVYDVGTNVAEMLGSSAVGGALLSGITAGGNTSGELYNLAKENGANDRQASTYGLAGGTVGGLLQAKGIDVINNKLGSSAIKGLGDVIKNVGAGALTEGLEEGLESGSQELLDSLINKDNSQRIKDYSEALSNGLSEEEARNYANKNSVSRILSSVATGAAMGGAFAGGSMALKPISKYVSSKLNISETNADNVISDAIRNSDDVPRNQITNQIDSETLPKSQSNTVNLDKELDNMSSVTNINSNKQTIEAPTNQSADTIIDSNSNYNKADNINDKDIADSIQTNNNIANDINDYSTRNSMRGVANSYIRNDNLKALKFDSKEDKAAFNNAVARFSRAVDSIDNIRSKEDIDATRSEINSAYKEIKDLLQNGYLLVNDAKDTYKAFRKRLLDTIDGYKILVTDADLNDINTYDTVRAMNNAVGRNLFTKDPNVGVPLDKSDLWPVLQSQIGELGEFSGVNSDGIARIIELSQDYKRGSLEGERFNNVFGFNDIFDTQLQSEIDDVLSGYESRLNNGTLTDVIGNTNNDSNIINDIQTNETSAIDGTVGTEKVGMPIVNENPTNDIAESRTITNTAKRSGIYRGISQQTLDAFSKHYVEHEIDTLDAASKALDTAEKRNEFVKAVINDKEDISSNVGVDKIMLSAHDLSAQYDDAIANGDINSATRLNTQRVLLIKKLDSSVSNAGRVLQSTAKWTRHTAQGVESSAYNILNSKAKTWEKTHIRDSKRIQDLSNRLDKRFATALSEMGKDVPEATATTDVYKPTIDELKNIINEELAKESSSIRNQFNDSDIDFIANLLNEGATTRDLTDFLNIKMATGTFGVKPDTMKAVNDIFESIQGLDENSKEYVDAEADALRLVANDLGKSSLFDKFEAWRYLAMLGNPKTMIRNYLGNNIFGFITGTSNNLAALLERGVDKVSGGRIQRTKSVLNPISDSKLIDASRNDADTKMYRQLNGTKYSDNLKQGLSRNKDAFDSKILRKASDLVDKGISDYTAVRRKYSTSLAGWLKANGYDASIFESKNPSDIEVLNKAREYAKAQAEYSTFHEDNAIARILTETSTKMKNEGTAGATAGHMLIEGLIPFKKTPANVLRSGVDYSPLGAVSSIAKTGKLMTGKATASDVIECWSKTLTGTGLAYLGYYLFDKGIVHINDGDTAKMDAQEGNQTYAINMNGKSYSIDWAAPGVMPLLLGAQLAKVVEESGGDIRQVFDKENGLGTILDSTGNLISPIIETSMLSGIADTMQSVSSAFNSGENVASAAVTGLANMASSYATQAIPTVGGQIARVVDPTRRSTYTDATGLDAIYKRQLNKVENKIPFLSAQNEPYIDMKGQTQNNSPFDNTLANAAYQFFSPAYIGNLQTDEGYQITRDVYNSENTNGQKIADKGALPKLETNVKIGGEKLDPQTYTEYQKVAGSTDAKIRNELAKNEVFNNLSNEQKNEVLKSVSTIASDSGKSAVSEEFTSTNKPYNIYNSGGTDALMNYFTEQFAKDDAEQHLAELGINNAKQSVIEYATEGHTDAEIKVYNEIKQYTKMKQWVPVLLKSNLTTEQKYDILLEQNNGKIPKKYKQNGTSKSDILKTYNDIVVLGK